MRDKLTDPITGFQPSIGHTEHSILAFADVDSFFRDKRNSSDIIITADDVIKKMSTEVLNVLEQ